MHVTEISVPSRSPETIGREYLGHYTLGVARELFGKEAIKTSRGISMRPMDLSIFSFMFPEPSVPGVDKNADVRVSLGDHTAIVGSGYARGLTSKVESVDLSIFGTTGRAASLARMALGVASGYGYTRYDVTYDGSLEVPEGVRHTHIENGSVYSNEAGVTFGDPYLPHPMADKYPNLYGNTPAPKLMDNKLFMISNTPNLAHSHYLAANVLELATDGEQSQADFTDMFASAQGLDPAEFRSALDAVRTEPPLKAARTILNFVA